MQKSIILLFVFAALLSCSRKEKNNRTPIPTGQWRATLYIQGKELPFTLVSKENDDGELQFIIKNSTEEIALDRFEIVGDTLILPMHIFDTKIVAQISPEDLKGIWTKNYEDDYRVEFRAEYGIEERFPAASDPIEYDFSGRWSARFYNDKTDYPAIGEFHQQGNKITGTFLKESGDARFLEGNLTGEGFQMSTFNGEFAYLYEAKLTEGDTLVGELWSGKTGYYQWKAYKNENASLSDPDSLTFLKDKSQPFAIALPNEKGDTIRLSDTRYQGKVLIVQILGSWCANCMDETAFLSKWYTENKSRGVEIVGLAFERKADFEYGASRIAILKKRYDIGYEILFAGKNDKATLNEVLTMITGKVSFPTTIFIDKKGAVRKIHTGFSGPGTGIHYETLIKDFNDTVDELLEE